MKNLYSLQLLKKRETYLEEINTNHNPVLEAEIPYLRVDFVFKNYAFYVEERRNAGEKNVRFLNQSTQAFWLNIEDLFYQQTGEGFFAWFYAKYFEGGLPIDDVHQRFLSFIHPLQLAYSAFYKFITQRAFIELRDRSSGQYTEIAQKRLQHRPSPVFSVEQCSEKSLKGWETRRKKMEDFLDQIDK